MAGGASKGRCLVLGAAPSRLPSLFTWNPRLRSAPQAGPCSVWGYDMPLLRSSTQTALQNQQNRKKCRSRRRDREPFRNCYETSAADTVFDRLDAARRSLSSNKCSVCEVQVIENKDPEGVTTTLLRASASFVTVAQPPPSAPRNVNPTCSVVNQQLRRPWGHRETCPHRVRCGLCSRLWPRG
jgi:hypothetical protein